MAVFSEKINDLAAEIARDGYDWRDDGPEVLEIVQLVAEDTEAEWHGEKGDESKDDQTPINFNTLDRQILATLRNIAAHFRWKLHRQNDILAMTLKLYRITQKRGGF